MNLPSPIVQLNGLKSSLGLELYLKREDLIHPFYGGNKWRKLKYNLTAFREGGYSELITFGGAFSNHIAATAAICKEQDIPCVGIIRGNYKDESNPTLLKALADGMQTFHVSKEAYRQKEDSAEVQNILSRYDKPFLIPEGGSNLLALKGVGEVMTEVYQEARTFDYVVVAAGTGTTAAGIISTSKAEKIVVINVLRNDGLDKSIATKIEGVSGEWDVLDDYHFGGFARTDDKLISFINNFSSEHSILLDPVYNGKAMYATLDLMEKGYFFAGSKVLYIHTGGQQGITAYNYRNRGGIEISTDIS